MNRAELKKSITKQLNEMSEAEMILMRIAQLNLILAKLPKHPDKKLPPMIPSRRQ